MDEKDCRGEGRMKKS